MSHIKSFMSDLPTPDTGISDFEFELETKGNPMTNYDRDAICWCNHSQGEHDAHGLCCECNCGNFRNANPSARQSKWYIRTSLRNYWAFESDKAPDTFLASWDRQNMAGEVEQPKPITLKCEYILEHIVKEIGIRSPQLVEAAQDIVVVQSNGRVALGLSR
jgi:hypothetical protein